jgi:uncharacterized protein (DUF2141 family)
MRARRCARIWDCRGRRTGSSSTSRGSAPALVVAILALLGAAPAFAAELTVTVDNLRNANGQIRLSVYASAAEWPDKSTDDHDRVAPALRGGVVLHFDLPPGTYAIDCFHDENSNGKFDQNFLGIPREGYAFSNNVHATFEAPSFASASFVVPPQGTALVIHMVYWRLFGSLRWDWLAGNEAWA